MFFEFVRQEWMLFLLLLMVLILLAVDPIRRRAGGVASVSSNDALRILQDDSAVVIDVSEEAEFRQGHISGAISSPASKLDKDIDRLSKYKDIPVVLACKSGQRSGRAAGQLSKAGFTKVHTLQGGMTNWLKDNLPVDKS